MVKIENLLELIPLISPTDVILFDMDNTLVNTDDINNVAYKSAIQQVLGKNYDNLFTDIVRIRREDVSNKLYWISKEQLSEIISIKSIIYKENIDQASLVIDVVELLENVSITNRCILVSNASADRVNQTLEYYNLKDKFDSMITRTDCDGNHNKFEVAINKLQLNPGNIWIVENEQKNINEALKHSVKHIILKENENIYYFPE
ncbi:MAG: hypothetical protein E7130_04780 [Rikenellaceae bacterium]|nr:hypothetical protein [Rikenellaceae bacterium]